MFKRILILFILIIGLITNTNAQKIERLKEANSSKKLSDDASIIYGHFIQRIGSDNKFYTQMIVLLNIVTNEAYSLNVGANHEKDTEKSFSFYIKPGMYKIHSYYYWTVSKWLIGKNHNELIYRDVDTSLRNHNYVYDSKDNRIDGYKLESYHIEIRPNSIYYIGTWDFSTGVVSFRDDKIDFDNKIKKEYRKIPFNEAITKLPE